MQTKQEVIETLKTVLPKYKIRQAAIFGSYARGDFTETSDVDLIIELDYENDFTKNFYGFWDDAELALSKPIDVISLKSLTESTKKRFSQGILNEMEWFYEA